MPSESINFATYYRPKTFAEVVGQDVAKTVLKKIAHADGISARAVFLKGSYGSGKCVKGNTRVATSSGYQQISKIKDGSEGFNEFITEVETRQGKRKSSHWYKESKCIVFEHVLQNNYIINGTYDHRVLALHNNVVDLHKIGELKKGDTILFPKTKIGEGWSHIPEKAYVTGLWLGDGFNSNGNLGFCGTYELCEKFATLVNWTGKIVQDKRRDNLWTVRKLKDDASLLDLSGHSDDKEIPEYIFCSDIESRVKFVQGLLETDGTIGSKGDVDFVMNSEVLITQLQQLLHTLGVSAYLSTKIARCGEYHKKVWRLRIPANQSGFPLEKNGRIWCHSNSMNDRNIIHVDGKYFSDIIRAHRVKFNNRKKNDIGAKLASNLRRCNALTERSLIMYKEFYGELPPELSSLVGYNFEEIKDTTTSVDDVYDLTVPEVHEFYCQGTYNHNTTLCKIFARAMNCEHFKETDDVCNECDSCKEASAANSQLYLEFDSSVVGNVDAIRSLQEKLSYSPKGRRVVVFDEIHAASKAAQNAMLKMVEDGVPDTIFVFASTEDVLPTIKSRSICVDISTIPLNLVKNRVLEIAKLQNINITEAIADTIALKSNGHMRDALSLLQLYFLCGEEGLKSSYSLIKKYFSLVIKKDSESANLLVSEIMKFNIVDIKNSIYIFIRNTYCSAQGTGLNKLVQTGIINKIFAFFFSPVAQSALKDEFGTELLLRNLITKMCK